MKKQTTTAINRDDYIAVSFYPMAAVNYSERNPNMHNSSVNLAPRTINITAGWMFRDEYIKLLRENNYPTSLFQQAEAQKCAQKYDKEKVEPILRAGNELYAQIYVNFNKAYIINNYSADLHTSLVNDNTGPVLANAISYLKTSDLPSIFSSASIVRRRNETTFAELMENLAKENSSSET